MKSLMVLTFWVGLTMAGAQPTADPTPEPFASYTLKDQHGKEHTLLPETRTIIMCFEMELSKSIHAWLATKDAGYLADHRAEYVADVSPMPGMVLKLFAGPKMRKYPFPIVLATDKTFAADYAKEEGKISVFRLTDDQQRATVEFVATVTELEAQLEPPPGDAPPDE